MENPDIETLFDVFTPIKSKETMEEDDTVAADSPLCGQCKRGFDGSIMAFVRGLGTSQFWRDSRRLLEGLEVATKPSLM